MSPELAFVTVAGLIFLVCALAAIWDFFHNFGFGAN